MRTTRRYRTVSYAIVESVVLPLLRCIIHVAMTTRSEVMIIIVHSYCISLRTVLSISITKKYTLVSDQSFCFLIVNIVPRIEVRSVLKPCFQGLSNDV